MANYANLKSAIQQVIKTNGNNEITGALLQQSLLAMINSLGGYYQFAGIATPSTNPGTPDQNVFYLASTAGTYSNFGSIVIAQNEAAILKYNGTWSKDSSGFATSEKVNQLSQDLNDVYEFLPGVKDLFIDSYNVNLSPYPYERNLAVIVSGVYEPYSQFGHGLSSLVPIVGGTSVYVKRHSDRASVIAFLSAMPTIGQSVSFASGYNDVITVANDGVYTAPVDAEYLYIQVEAKNGNPTTPTKLAISENNTLRSGLERCVLAYDITSMFPLTSGYYTLETAVQKITANMAKVGMVIGFRDGIYTTKLYKLTGVAGTVWYQNPANYTEINFLTTDDANTIKSLSLDNRLNFNNYYKGMFFVNSTTQKIEINGRSNGRHIRVDFNMNGKTVAYYGYGDSTYPSILMELEDGTINKVHFTAPVGLHFYTFSVNTKYVIFQCIESAGGYISGIGAGIIYSKINEVSGQLYPYRNGVLRNDVLFSTPMVKPGDIVEFSIENNRQRAIYIDLLNSSGNRITFYGKASSSTGMRNEVHGSFIVPQGFSYAILGGGDYGINTVNYVVKRDSQISSQLQKISFDINDVKRDTDNRIANINIESFSSWNAQHPDNQIIEHSAISPMGGRSSVFNPASIITNNGTILVACENRQTGNDYGEIDIALARKANGDTEFTSQILLSYSEQGGTLLNPIFVIDRNGLQGTQGRIFLFYGFNSSNSLAINASRNDLNAFYVYSDNDGLTWSDPVSIKENWGDEAIGYLPAPSNGIILNDGTIVIPLMNVMQGNAAGTAKFWASGVAYLPVGGVWHFSKCVLYGTNECSVFERNTNEIVLVCRQEFQERKTYVYNVGTDEWLCEPNSFNSRYQTQFHIEKAVLSGQTLYLMSYPDSIGLYSQAEGRINLTVWASMDGEKWIRVYRAWMGQTSGYSCTVSHNARIVVSCGINNIIKVQEITPILSLFVDAVRIQLNRSSEDRLQELIDVVKSMISNQ